MFFKVLSAPLEIRVSKLPDLRDAKLNYIGTDSKL